MNEVLRRRILSALIVNVVLLFGVTGCLDKEPPPAGIQLTSVFTGPSDLPGDLAWDGEALWVVDPIDVRLRRVDVSSGTVLAEVELPSPDDWVVGIAWDGEALWAALAFPPGLMQLDPETGQSRRELSLPLEGEEDPLSLTWDGEALWILTESALVRVDPQTGEKLTRLPLPGGEVSAVTWAQSQLIITERTLRLLMVLSPIDGHVVISWPLPDPILSPSGIAWDGRTLWLSEEIDGRVYQLRLPPFKP